jgi:hypothetical protein
MGYEETGGRRDETKKRRWEERKKGRRGKMMEKNRWIKEGTEKRD